KTRMAVFLYAAAPGRRSSSTGGMIWFNIALFPHCDDDGIQYRIARHTHASHLYAVDGNDRPAQPVTPGHQHRTMGVTRHPLWIEAAAFRIAAGLLLTGGQLSREHLSGTPVPAYRAPHVPVRKGMPMSDWIDLFNGRDLIGW